MILHCHVKGKKQVRIGVEVLAHSKDIEWISWTESKPCELKKRKTAVLIELSRNKKLFFFWNEKKWLMRNRREEIERGGEVRTEEIYNK